VSKVSASAGGTAWLHDLAGRVLHEEGADYARDYVWAEGVLLGYEEERDTDGDGTRERFRRYILTDHLGSAIAVLDEAGNLLSTMDYSAFGESGDVSPVLAPIYTGKQWDSDAGLYYFNARWYDPELGRFTTEDPIKDGGNWYAYVGNRPLVATDPSGLLKKHKKNNSITLEEGDYFYEGAEAAGWGDGRDDYKKAITQGVITDPEGKLVLDADKWFDTEGNLTEYFRENIKSLAGYTIASKGSKAIYLLRGHSKAKRKDYDRSGGETYGADKREITIIKAVTSSLKEALEDEGYFVALDPQVDWPNSTTYDRESMARDIQKVQTKFSAMLAIHSNAFNGIKSGTEIYGPYDRKNNPSSYRLCDSIFSALIAGKYGNSSFTVDSHPYIPLGADKTPKIGFPTIPHSVPSVLIEAGYYDNAKDYANYTDMTFLRGFVKAVVSGLNAALK